MATAPTWVAHLKTAGSALVWVLGWILSIGYLVTIPLRYPLYYAFRLILFLLSPVWPLLHAIRSAAGLVVDFVVRLKYLYIYLAYAVIIGVLAGCVLHGTSNFIFVLLGVDSTTATADKERRRDRAAAAAGSEEEEEEEYGMELEFWSGDGSTTPTPTLATLSSTTTTSSSSRRPIKKSQKKDPTALDHHQLFESRWKLLRASEKPRRRRRGLLAQTIHEESSESDSL